MAQCMKWLEDQVFSIREAATKNLQQLASEFGPDWAKEHLVPQVRPLSHPAHMCIRCPCIYVYMPSVNSIRCGASTSCTFWSDMYVQLSSGPLT